CSSDLAPVVGIVTPQGREDRFAALDLAAPVIAMAQCALGFIDFLSTQYIGFLFGLVQSGVAASIEGVTRLIQWHARGQPLVVGSQCKHVVAAVGGGFAVHGVGEAAGNALFKRVDMVILRTIVR